MKVFFKLFYLFIYLLAVLHSIWDITSPTRDRSRAPCIERRILNQWTTREVPKVLILSKIRAFVTEKVRAEQILTKRCWKSFPAEGAASAKALRQEHTWVFVDRLNDLSVWGWNN